MATYQILVTDELTHLTANTDVVTSIDFNGNKAVFTDSFKKATKLEEIKGGIIVNESGSDMFSD